MDVHTKIFYVIVASYNSISAQNWRYYYREVTLVVLTGCPALGPTKDDKVKGATIDFEFRDFHASMTKDTNCQAPLTTLTVR